MCASGLALRGLQADSHSALHLFTRRWSRAQLPIDITRVISNHSDVETAVKSFGVPFHHVPVNTGNKAQAEDKILELLSDDTDLVVLARAVRWHAEDRILLHQNRTVVFAEW